MTATDDEVDADQADRDATDRPEGSAAPDTTGDVHTYIGARLRKAFDDVAKQPIPERFLQLIRDLDRA